MQDGSDGAHVVDARAVSLSAPMAVLPVKLTLRSKRQGAEAPGNEAGRGLERQKQKSPALGLGFSWRIRLG
jgi:hypothetical protein